jgi:23S rRNA (uracil1939-C5)-methyltransferase
MVQIYRPKKASAPAKNLRLKVKIDRLDHSAVAVCASHQPVLFVEGALPGEECEVLVVEQKPRYWRAKLAKVLLASEHRLKPFCPHFDNCGGCQTQYAQPLAMLEAKQEAVSELVQRATGLSALPWQAPLLDEAQAYRRKTRLALDCRDKTKPIIGFRAKGSKQVIPISQCAILHTSLQALISPLSLLLTRMDNPGVIGHISLLRGDTLTQVCVRITRSLTQADKTLLLDFAQSHDCQLLLEMQKDEFEYLTHTNEQLFYSLDGGIKVYLQANDFVQVNASINQQMITQAMAWLELDKNDQVLDLFCGVGNFSLPMARQCKFVTGIEGVSALVQRATDNALKNGIDNCVFYQCDLNEADSLSDPAYASCNKVLLDPAREGAFALIPQLSKLKAEKILYVSCNPATFVRDSKELVEQGYSLSKIGLMDMFPNTAHTELMALFVHNHKFKK